MSITLHNYEIYFIDHYEGNLSAAQATELMAFLHAHPDLKKEFEDYENTSISPDKSITYKNKASLRKTLKITTISDEDIKLSPDLSITYPDKDKLRKRAGVIVLYPGALRYAAAIIILLGIASLLLFYPSATDEKNDAALALLQRQRMYLSNQNIAPAALEFRTSNEMQWHSAEREEIVLEKVPSSAFAGNIKAPAYYSSVINLNYRSTYPSYELMNNDDHSTVADKTMTGRVISGFFNKIKKPFTSDIPKEKIQKEKGFSFWDVADIGIKGINALGDHEYTLVRKYDEQGDVKGVMVVEE